MRSYILLLILVTLTTAGLALPRTIYENARFGYQLSLPPGLTIVDRANDGSGITWQTGTVKVEVYGTNNPYRLSPEQLFASVRQAAGRQLVDERLGHHQAGPPWQEVLYLKDGRRHHRKTFVGPGSIVTVEVSYAYRLRKTKQPMGQQIVDSLRPGSLSTPH